MSNPHARPGYVAEEWLGQIRHDGKWLDYARGTEAASRAWQAADPDNRRVVDWIRKENVLIGATGEVNDFPCPRCKAPVDASCQTPSGNPANEPHAARVNRYWKARS